MNIIYYILSKNRNFTFIFFFVLFLLLFIILLQKGIQPYIQYIHTWAPLNSTLPDSLDPIVHICLVKKKIRKDAPFAQNDSQTYVGIYIQ